MSCIPREALFSPFPIFFARGAAEVLYRAEILHISLLEHRELLRIAVKIEESLFIVRVRIQIEVYVYQNEPALHYLHKQFISVRHDYSSLPHPQLRAISPACTKGIYKLLKYVPCIKAASGSAQFS